jgi:carboxyl-terminal processing protease
MSASRRLRAPVLVLAGFFAGTVTTVAVAALAASGGDGLYRKLEVLSQVLGQIERQYVDNVSDTELVYGAAKGAVGVLDEHSAFYSPDEYKQLLDATEGEFAGIGIEVEWEHELPHVVAVLEGSAAARAGVQAGDRIVAVDGTPTASLSVDAVQQRLRGPVGSKVVLTIRRRQRDDDWTFTLVRSWVRIAPVESRRLEDGLVYVKVKTFSRRVASDFAAAVGREQPIKGLVIDLRGDPGGLFDEAITLADYFLKQGPIVTAVGRGGRVIERYEAHDQGHEPDYPVAVLIDRGSASAAEVLAGSLADRGRARLFGTTSYGKGSVQSVLDLADGSGLKLTVARYYTPSGRQIDGHGIKPDQVVEPVGGSDAPLDAATVWLRGAVK